MKKTLSFILCLALLCALLSVGASAYDVVLSPQNLTVNGQSVTCEKYNIDGSNYFKLRDIAMLLMGTDSEFGVGYDEVARSIIVVPGMPYEPVGGELVVGEDKSASAVPSTQSLWFLDAPADGLSVYNIGGNNFFKLRDLGTLIGFNVDYDSATNTAIVETADYSDAPLGNVNQTIAFHTVWDWVDANYNADMGGEKEYYEDFAWDDGESAEYELIATELGGDKTLVLVSTYYYSDGSADMTWIFLEPEVAAYYVSYDYYDVGFEDLLEADFTGSLDLVPGRFDSEAPVSFESASGQLAEHAEDFGAMAATGIADTLLWFSELMETADGLADNVSLWDFGFGA